MQHLSYKSHYKKTKRFFEHHELDKKQLIYFQLKPSKFKEYKELVEEHEKNCIDKNEMDEKAKQIQQNQQQEENENITIEKNNYLNRKRRIELSKQTNLSIRNKINPIERERTKNMVKNYNFKIGENITYIPLKLYHPNRGNVHTGAKPPWEYNSSEEEEEIVEIKKTGVNGGKIDFIGPSLPNTINKQIHHQFNQN